MTKAELTEAIVKNTGLDKTVVSKVVDSLLRQATRTLKNGDNIYLRGFGTFAIKTRKAKKARHITANKEILLPARKVVAFKPANAVKAAVAKGTHS
jgi:DNA-binding protein HU-beta